MDDPMLGRRRPAREAAMLERLNASDWSHAAGPFAAFGFSFVVRSQEPDVGAYLDVVLGPLATSAPARHVYSVVDRGERHHYRYALYLDGRLIRAAIEPESAILYFLWHLNRSAVRESPDYLLIHASAAEHRGMALLFPATMESGKTTLVAGLLQRGMGYLTDEAVGIDPSSGLAHAFPKSLAIDPGSWEVLATLKPVLQPRLARFADYQWHVDPRTIRANIISRPCRPRLVVSPRYEQGAVTRLEPLRRSEGLIMLAENAFNFARHGSLGLEALAEVVAGCECYRLTIGTLSDACDAVMALAEECSSRPAAV